MPGEDTERDVGRRADLARDAPVGEQADDGRVLDRAYPVTDPGRLKLLDGPRDGGCPEQLAGVRYGDQAAGPGDAERLGELVRVPVEAL